MASTEMLSQLKECIKLHKFSSSCAEAKHIYTKMFELCLNRFVRNEIVDKFWSHFSIEDFQKYDRHSHKPLIDAVFFLRAVIQKVEDKVAEPQMMVHFNDSLRTQLLSDRPHNLNEFLETTYFRGLRIFLELENQESQFKDEDSMDCEDECANYKEYDEYYETSETKSASELCRGCSFDCDDCACSSIYEDFKRMNENLRELNLLEVLASETVINVSRVFIERRVLAKGKSSYSRSYFKPLLSWVNKVIGRWVSGVLGKSTDNDDTICATLERIFKDAYAEVRVSQMFEIILEYPSSDEAIEDLRQCLEDSNSPSFRLNLINSVRHSLVESLLHPDVNTFDVLTAYISAIKALRALDPTGLILQLVTEPVRRYLKSRSDTVRCIVTALTDDDHSSLNKEMLIRSDSQTNENGEDGKSGAIEMNLPNEGEKCTAANFEQWKPDPIKLNSLDDNMKTSRFSDIVSILVNIYETKDLFVEEYQKLLSQRLLSKYDECNLDTEFRNLELLTLRFSDCELHRCEVMLRDVQTSKRIRKRITQGDIKDHKLSDFKNLDVLIVSSPFWPDKFGPIATLYDEQPKIAFPNEIQVAIDTYTRAFETIQASRTLFWRHHLGSVNLDVTVGGKVQNFTVSPLHASLLWMFKEKHSWRVHELIQETSLTAAAIRSRLALWQRNGLIKDCGEDRFELICD